jgi:hypothetical protein
VDYFLAAMKDFFVSIIGFNVIFRDTMIA